MKEKQVTVPIHILIGTSVCEKSTFANEWLKQDPNCVIISTSESELLKKAQAALGASKSVIYDAANNIYRPSRIDIINKFKNIGFKNCIGWYFGKYQDEFNRRNEPQVAEGFAKVIKVPIANGKYDFDKINEEIRKLPRAIINRHNINKKKILHQYSDLLGFERLMHLIALLANINGAGLLHVINPHYLQTILGDTKKVSDITDSIDEICALMSSRYHSIYADKDYLIQDLAWLENNGLIGDSNINQEITVSDYSGDKQKFEAHTYSDIDTFTRLIKIIRCTIHYPCFRDEANKKNQDLFFESLQSRIYGLTKHQLRKDIEQVIHPYQIFPNTTMKRAYFIGTGILAKSELVEVFNILHSHARELDDPKALSTYETFRQKLELSQLMTSDYFTKAPSNPNMNNNM